ncbi:DNA-3-methyladenine glycosylase 2 family protein [Methylobacterium sp. P1-11]|uniref:DNA-3-methyladenine glycosylase 2 family protein n=1 Tax=Methylobacterium sp. P1-11 TaxID=2024616 RepID=UPI0011F02A2C|nr:DNA-3-methyladenine glycosylase 2 family protein [Methylobacterium sp. P1-11]KAA0123378.1 DNA-3-methyladenine glycosylase 2 family protein [Methylobacterium sp. P1-11]
MLDPDIYAHLLDAARAHPPLRAALVQAGPIRIEPPAHPRVADRLFVEVVNQQLSTRAAAAIWARIEAAAAAAASSPRALFEAGDAAMLRACGISGNKVRALQAIVTAETAGLLGPGLAGLPHAERAAILCSIRGVGPWTADMVGIFHFHDPDIWPAGDVAAVGCLHRLTGRDDTGAVAAAFAPYRSILARYLWRIKDTAPVPVDAKAEQDPPRQDLPSRTRHPRGAAKSG